MIVTLGRTVATMTLVLLVSAALLVVMVVVLNLIATGGPGSGGDIWPNVSALFE